MIIRVFKLGVMMALAFMLTSCGSAENDKQDVKIDNSENYRLTLKIDDVTVKASDDLVAVPVYISHPTDTLAGIEVHFRMDENPNIYFASDETRADGMLMSADTAGSVMSGWEWMGVNSLDDGVFDLRVVGLADWPNEVQTIPAMPSGGELMFTMYLRINTAHPVVEEKKLDIVVNAGKTSFATPTGSTIGLVTTYEKYCDQYVGDSCISWKQKPIATLDTSVVNFQNGSVTITPAGQ